MSSKYYRQTSFASGEFSPRLFGRSDYARYSSALSYLKNFYVTEQGTMRTRPGSKYVTNTDTDTETRLIPFSFDRDQTYILAFSNFLCTVIQNGGVVQAAGGGDYTFATPYSSAQVPDIRFVQSKDVLILVHPDHPPYELARLDHNDWVLAPIDFSIQTTAPTGVAATPTGTGTRNYQYVVTTVDDTTLEESAQSASATAANGTLGGEVFNTVTWNAVTGARHYRVYRLTGGVYTFIGFAETTTFVDEGIEPDVYSSPPIDYNPFVNGNYPQAVTFWQQRLVFGGGNQRPQTLWFSKPGEFFNFGYSTTGSPDDSIEVTLTSQTADSIQHLLATRTLMVFTRANETEVSFTGDGLSLETIQLRPQTYRGSGRVRPLPVGHELLFVEDKGDAVRAAAYSWEQDTYVTADLTILSEHLTRGHQIRDWTYAQMPNSTLWVTRDDGLLLSLTYNSDQELVGWARHDTEGLFENVASVSEGEEDAVYAVVKRNINGADVRFIERFGDTIYDDQCEATMLDAGLKYAGAATSTLSGLDHLEGETVQVMGDCGVLPDQVVSSGAITLPVEVTTAEVGLRFVPEGLTMPIASAGRADLTNIAKRPGEVFARLLNTRNFAVGATLGELVDLQERQPQIDYGELSALMTGIYSQHIFAAYNMDAMIAFRATTPHPAEVQMLGIEFGHGV